MKTITGVVKDNTGETIVGATITADGGKTGTITDADGHYSLKDVDPNASLTISYIGYTTKQEPVKGRSVVNVTLKVDAEILDEVVVVGYGSVKQSNLTGAISKFKTDKISERPIARAENALQGAMSGVTVRTTTGEPGKDMQIRVRGAASINASSDPLYIVDGVPTESLIGINPSDIASIEVLKDAASAAIYGSRGSNGVVMVTTRKGKTGKPKITFTANYGVQSLLKKMDLLSGEEWMNLHLKYNDATYLNEAAKHGIVGSISDPNNVRMANIGGSIDKPNINVVMDDRWFNYLDDNARATHTYTQTNDQLAMLDWQDNFYRSGTDASVKSYNLDLSGGTTDGTNYLFSIGYFDQAGLATGTGYKKISMRINVDSKINSWLTAGVKLAPTYSMQDGAGKTDGKDSESHHVLSSAPVSPADVGYMTNVDPNPQYLWAFSTSSPTYVMNTNLSKNDVMRMMAMGYIKVEPLKGLSIQGTASTNFYDADGRSYNYSSASKTWALGEGASSSLGHNTARRFDNTLLQMVANYNKEYKKNNFTFMLGGSAEQSNVGFTTNQTFNKPFPNDAFPESADATTLAVGRDQVIKLTPINLASYFARIQYDYDDRYFMTASMRRDACSVFGKNNKWGSFPALSAAWKISNEAFFKNLNLTTINFLKLRASVGVTGNNKISSTAAYSMLNSSIYAGGAGYTSKTLGNPDLGWEKSTSTDIALDLGLLNNRIQASFDYYTKKTTDLLYQVPVLAASGVQTVWENMGDLNNSGFEMELTTQNLTGKVRWTTSFNLSYNQNTVKRLGTDDTPIYSGFSSGIANASNVMEVGRPLNTFYMYEAQGVWMNQKEINDYSAAHGGKPVTFLGKAIKPGDIRYSDANDDGVFDTNDKKYLGNPTPTFTYGMTNTVSYKKFDLSLLLTAQSGGKIYGILGRAIDRPGMGAGTNALGRWRNAWWSEAEPGDGSTPYPLSTTTGTAIDSRWLYSSNYLAIKNLTIGYALPSNKYIASARVYASIENLANFNSYYGGYSPEATNTSSSSAPGGAGALGIDYGSYPMARTVSLGINVTF